MSERFTPIRFESHSEEETYKWGMSFASKLIPGTVICLDGDLGAGKTVLAKGIAQGLQVEEPVTSPTFTLVNSHAGRLSDGRPVVLHHFDVYRLDDAEELLGIGWDDYLDGRAICLVEWAVKFPWLIPEDALSIRLSRLDDAAETRIIQVTRGQPLETEELA